MTVSPPTTHTPIESSRPLFFEKFVVLERVAARILNHDWTGGPVSTQLNAALGLLCWEDFEEITYLAKNGMGFGCQKILRGMWERGVVAAHLAKNPAETGRFIKFNFLSMYKLMKSMQANEALAGIREEYVKEVTEQRQKYKEQFTRTCPEKGCDRTIASFNWSAMDIVSMARASAPDLLPLATQGCYMPMNHTHPSMGAIAAHVEARPESLANSRNRAREHVEIALCTAHQIVIAVLKQQAAFLPDKGEFASFAGPLRR